MTARRFPRSSAIRWAPRWALAVAGASLPPGPNLVAVGAIWAVAVGFEGAAGVGPAALLSAVAVIANVVIYTSV